MKNRLLLFIKYALSWLAFLFFAKLVFLLVNLNKSSEFILLWPKIFAKGFLLDLSMLGYVMILPTLLIFVNCIITGRWLITVFKIYTWFLLVVFSILIVADLVIYPEWGFRLDITPLFYMKNMDEALASVSTGSLIFYFIVSVIIPLPFIFLFNKGYKKHSNELTVRNYYGLPVFLFLTAFLFLPIRGGLGTAPINTGSVYFHENSFVNHASLNLPWNIIYSITNVDDYSNPFLFYPDKEELPQKVNKELRSSSLPVLNTQNPNILILIMESFTSAVVGSLNSEVSATPQLDSIIKNGWLFNNFYASGDRSDKGLAAILSGFPSLPTTTIIKYPNKTEKLPGIAKSLSNRGYNSTFYYGGDINFAGMKAYLINIGFDQTISQNDFQEKTHTSNWGVPDEFLFDKLYEDIKKEQTPYFKVAFTLSSHPPYDVPELEKYFEGSDDVSLFLNSVSYTDNKLGQFITKLETERKLENTLVIIVADHGSILPGNFPHSSPLKYHIPMVWYGPALRDSLKGTTNSMYAGQTDIPAMLLSQLNLDNSEYIFSRDILNRDFPSETFYAFWYGFGYLSENNKYMYYRKQDRFEYITDLKNDSIENIGKHYYQNLYTHFQSLQ